MLGGRDVDVQEAGATAPLGRPGPRAQSCTKGEATKGVGLAWTMQLNLPAQPADVMSMQALWTLDSSI